MSEKLDDTQLEALRSKYRKIAIVDWEEHQLVFRKPTRDDMRQYWREKDSAPEAPNALDKLSQVLMVSYDGIPDPSARVHYSDQFLEDFPGFTRSGKAALALAHLMGVVEQESDEALGKGVRVLSAVPRNMPAGLPNGSPTSTVVRN